MEQNTTRYKFNADEIRVLKVRAENMATALGYNKDSLSLEIVNVKDSYCYGYTDGYSSLKADNTRLEEENAELKIKLIDLVNKYCFLEKEKKELLDILQEVVDSWGKSHPYKEKLHEAVEINGETFGPYWSPASALVESSVINSARKLIDKYTIPII